MSHRSIVWVSLALLLTAAGVGADEPQTLGLRDLANHPERWPGEVTLNREFRFGGGDVASAGQRVGVLGYRGQLLTVDAGNGLVFDIKPEESDLVDAANAVWATLTPEQRAVDMEMLIKDASLWPLEVVSKATIQFDDGSMMASGAVVTLLSVDRSGLKLHSAEHQATFMVDVEQSDLIARARERVMLSPDQRPSRMAALLAGNLLDAKGQPIEGEAAMAGLESVKLYALYYSASWCGPCVTFSPDLVKFAQQARAENPNLRVILMSNDENPSDMLAYMKKSKMDWPVVPLARLQQSPMLLSYVHGAIPQLAIVDRNGALLADAYQNGRYVGPQQALKELQRRVKAGEAR